MILQRKAKWFVAGGKEKMVDQRKNGRSERMLEKYHLGKLWGTIK